MGLDRRTFLQQAGLACLTWGAAEAGISSLANQERLGAALKNYQHALAQPTSRKLALLVGIDRYPHQDDLTGCLTDLELQRELLIHRFGFNPQDILTLSDRQATRANIETAFIEHLTQQAKADDVVVFHFSGYGGQVKMPLASEGTAVKELSDSDNFRLVNSFIPVDGLASAKKNQFANSILQETLLVLAQTLSTAKCTFVLDTSFNTTERNQHGSFKVRSLNRIADNPSSEELAFLIQLREDFSSKGLKPSKRLLSLPGVVLSAASNNQVAVERQWDSLSAGLFTQALTQHLWNVSPRSRVQVALARTAETVEQVMGRQQQPTLSNPDKSAIAYYLATSDVPNAAGIVHKINQNSVEIKLLGLPANVIDGYGTNSCLSLVSAPENSAPQIQVRSKEGLLIKAQIIGDMPSLQTGQFVRETIRMIDRNLSLNLVLNADLNRIERVDATSALANIDAINSAIVAKDDNADCLIGKVANEASIATDDNVEGVAPSYGLYTAGGDLIGKTTGAAEEAVKIAIERLKPQFNNLLAAKWLELTSNDFSSQIKAVATLLTPEIKSPLWQKSTLAANNIATSKKPLFSANLVPETTSNVPLIAKNTEIRLNIGNTDPRQLYTIVMSSDSNCNIYAVYTPAQSSSDEGVVQLEETAIAPETELSIPTPESSWKWKVADAPGINTLYVVMSVKPFTETLKAFASQQNFKLDQQQVLNVTNPISVVDALMQDLHNSSAVETKLLPSQDVYALDISCWTTLKFVYEISNS